MLRQAELDDNLVLYVKLLVIGEAGVARLVCRGEYDSCGEYQIERQTK